MQANEARIESFSKNIFGLLSRLILSQFDVFTKCYRMDLNFMTLSAYPVLTHEKL